MQRWVYLPTFITSANERLTPQTPPAVLSQAEDSGAAAALLPLALPLPFVLELVLEAAVCAVAGAAAGAD